MNNFKLSYIIKGSVSLLGLLSVGNFLVAPASAEQAAVRGAVTVVRPSGSSISVSGELVAPTGGAFTTNVTIAPTGSDPGTNKETISSLLITPGGYTAPSTTVSGNSFLDAAAAKLTAATTVEDQAAIIRAGAGVNGLGGLE